MNVTLEKYNGEKCGANAKNKEQNTWAKHSDILCGDRRSKAVSDARRELAQKNGIAKWRSSHDDHLLGQLEQKPDRNQGNRAALTA